uniref:Uncharacterized protein n=1 Tax=viral metagenome TaxID=1070528 RepID=A0A6C0CNQ2_9ZZZZ
MRKAIGYVTGFGRNNSEGAAGGLGYARADPNYKPVQPNPQGGNPKPPQQRRVSDGSRSVGQPIQTQGWLASINQRLWSAIAGQQTRISAVLSSTALTLGESKIKHNFETGIYFKKRQVTDDKYQYTIGGFEIEGVEKSNAQKLITKYEQHRTNHEDIYKNYEYFCLPTFFTFSEKYGRVFATDCSREYGSVDKYNYAHEKPLCDAVETLHKKSICLTNATTVIDMEKNYLILFDKRKKTAIFASTVFLNAEPAPEFSDYNRSLDWINVCYIISKHRKSKFDEYYKTTCKQYKIRPADEIVEAFLEYMSEQTRGNQNQNSRKLEENPRAKLGQKLRAQYANASETDVEVPYVETPNPNETQEERINRRYALCDGAETADADTTEKCTKFCEWSPLQLPNRFRVVIKHHGILGCFNLQQAYEECVAFETNQKRKIKEIYKSMHEQYAMEIIKFFQRFNRHLSIKDTDVVETEDKKGKREYLKSIIYIENAPDKPAIEVNGIGYTTKRRYTPPSGRYKRMLNWFSKQQLDSDPQNSIHFERNERGNELFGLCKNLTDIYTDEETGMHYYMDPTGPRLVPFGIYAALLDAKTNKPRRLDQQRPIQAQKPTQVPAQVQNRGQAQVQAQPAPGHKGSFTSEEEETLRKIVEEINDPEVTVDMLKDIVRQENLSVAEFVKKIERNK